LAQGPERGVQVRKVARILFQHPMPCIALLLSALIGLAQSSDVDVCNENAACMNADNAAACRARRDECGGRMQILESCPLQFACPQKDVCEETEACMNADNAAACRARRAECGDMMLILKSCPLQFACPQPCMCGQPCHMANGGVGTCMEDGFSCVLPLVAPDCPLTCGTIKDAYRTSSCCNNPSKLFMLSPRRLSSTEVDSGVLLQEVERQLMQAKSTGGDKAVELSREIKQIIDLYV